MCSNTLVSLFSPRPSLHHILILQPETQNNLGFSFYTVCVEKVELTKNMYKSHKKNQEKWLTIFILSFCGGLSNRNGWKRHKNTHTHTLTVRPYIHSRIQPSAVSRAAESAWRHAPPPRAPPPSGTDTRRWSPEPPDLQHRTADILSHVREKTMCLQYFFFFQNTRILDNTGVTLDTVAMKVEHYSPPGVPFGKITSCSLWNLMVNGTLISTLRGTTSQTKYLTKLEGLTFRLKKKKTGVSYTLKEY